MYLLLSNKVVFYTALWSVPPPPIPLTATFGVGKVAAICVVGVGAGRELDVAQLQNAGHKLPQCSHLLFPEPDDPHALLQVPWSIGTTNKKHEEVTLKP